jgi:hypothetical protein
MPKMCINGPKVNSGQHQNVFERLHTDFGQTNRQPSEKETPSNFVVFVIRTFAYLMFFLGFSTFFLQIFKPLSTCISC